MIERSSDLAADRERRLQILLDKEEIHEVIVHYCRGVDRGDPQMVLSAFHDDATDNHSGTELPARDAIVSAREQPAESERQAAGLPIATSHNICNEL